VIWKCFIIGNPFSVLILYLRYAEIPLNRNGTMMRRFEYRTLWICCNKIWFPVGCIVVEENLIHKEEGEMKLGVVHWNRASQDALGA